MKVIPALTDRQRARFWSHVEKGSESACWPWTAATVEGYGRFGNYAAHRVAYTLERGPIPDGQTLDHVCQNRLCQNPNHLEPVSAVENVRRRRLPVTEPSQYRTRSRGPERYTRRRDRGLCVQCNTPSERYRCDECRAEHNARGKQRRVDRVTTG